MGAIAHSDQVIPAARRRRRGHTAPHGQFFTLTEVARFLWHVVEMLAPASQRRVIDLAAGDGILLDEGCRGGFTTRLDVLGLELDAHVLHARSAEGARVEAGDGLLDAGQRLSDWPASTLWPISSFCAASRRST